VSFAQSMTVPVGTVGGPNAMPDVTGAGSVDAYGITRQSVGSDSAITGRLTQFGDDGSAAARSTSSSMRAAAPRLASEPPLAVEKAGCALSRTDASRDRL